LENQLKRNQMFHQQATREKRRRNAQNDS
jgi:hypothetical protein